MVRESNKGAQRIPGDHVVLAREYEANPGWEEKLKGSDLESKDDDHKSKVYLQQEWTCGKY